MWSRVSGLLASATAFAAASAGACFLKELIDHISRSKVESHKWNVSEHDTKGDEDDRFPWTFGIVTSRLLQPLNSR